MTEQRTADEPSPDEWREARLILIRHGESVWNAEGRVQGQLGTGLSATGRKQAEAVAAHLLATYPHPAKVFSSDLERVVQTAEPYLSRTGRPAEFDKRLREIDTGEWSGLLLREAAERFPDEFAAFRGGEDVPRGGGETFAAMRNRVGEALRDIARSTVHDAPTTAIPAALLFTHGGPILVAVAEAIGLPPNGHRRLEPPSNCSVTVLDAALDADGEVESIRLSSYNGVHLSHHAT